MDHSPRKRVTRARVAAKAAAEANSNAKNKTAVAPKAGPITKTTTNTPASIAPIPSSKRKARTDETLEREERQRNKLVGEKSLSLNPKTTRTRTRKTAPDTTETELEIKPGPEPKVVDTLASKKPTRGRPRKAPLIKAVPEPTRILRGRVSKLNDNDEISKKVPVKEIQPTGTRRQEADPNNTAITTKTTSITKPAEPKRCIKFDQSGKENIIPTTTKQRRKNLENDDVPSGTGFRAKPVRKPAPKARATRSRTKPAQKEEVTKPTAYPLSPKNFINGALKECSDDELALNVTNKFSSSPLKLSPKKRTARTFNVSENNNLLSPASKIHPDHSSSGLKDELKTTIMSPARRPPQAPFKDGMKMSAQKIDAENLFLKPNPTCTPASRLEIKNDSGKHPLFNSPARRAPQSPAKSILGESSLKLSTNHKSFATMIPRLDPSVDKSSCDNNDNNLKTSQLANSLQSPVTNKQKNTVSVMAALGTPLDTIDLMKNLCESNEKPNDIMIPGNEENFSGRMSSIVPREVDPTLQTDLMPEELKMVTDMIYQQAAESTQILENQDDFSCNTVNKNKILVEKFEEIKFDPFVMRTSDSLSSEESDSEDELSTILGSRRAINTTSTVKRYKFLTPGSKTPFKLKQSENIGFTPLAQQLSHWMSSSPSKNSNTHGSVFSEILSHNWDSKSAGVEEVDEKNALEISNSSVSHNDNQTTHETTASKQEDLEISEEGFGPVELDREDLELALEANEMSLLDSSHIKTPEYVMFPLDSPENGASNCGISLKIKLEDNLSEEIGTLDGEEASLTIKDISPTELGEKLNENETLDPPEKGANDSSVPSSNLQENNLLEDIGAPDRDEASLTTKDVPLIGLSEELNELDNSDLLIDPQLLALPAQPEEISLKTPKRIISQKTYHTVCKIPLKPEASATPVKPLIQRSASVCRIPATRSSTTGVDSERFLNTLADNRRSYDRNSSRDFVSANSAIVTPSKQTLDLSSFGTPARTPRPDLNTSLLRGAVVFVDVYTAEGSDASYIFTEVLTLMGARCVKSWSWSGNIEEGKIGITHVVFKDGGKRTMEKVRECNGLVTCVGVGWVLDCERANKWIDETPYLVDTAVFPREGGRRRKSMEPRALTNMNGTLFPWPNTCRPQRHCSIGNYTEENLGENEQTPMTSKSHRRDSIRWHHLDSHADDDKKIKSQLFSPIPPTPGLETLAAYENKMDETYQEASTLDETDDEGSDVSYFLHKEQLMQKTAPVKRYFNPEPRSNSPSHQKSMNTTRGNSSNFAIKGDSERSTVSEMQDKNLMMRLMAARRKSLQWAPKIGSPLARAL
ncbi:putative signal transducer protein [Golovinomyces cichoracearum]|uniref:Putative signal transducer protein n=1 Tax=Golovinomyces cichoracearum TaxID=62708 RepID=A0A420IAR4_9PEZI|nr:putative signal transducer protein [Golovinomyces cichoracearum]